MYIFAAVINLNLIILSDNAEIEETNFKRSESIFSRLNYKW